MPGLNNFMRGLSNSQWDTMIQVLHDLQDSTSPDRLESLRQFLATLTREIESINRKRDAIGQKVANLDILLPVIDDRLKRESDLELEMFKNILLTWRSSLKKEITEDRPNGKLEKK